MHSAEEVSGGERFPVLTQVVAASQASCMRFRKHVTCRCEHCDSATLHWRSGYDEKILPPRREITGNPCWDAKRVKRLIGHYESLSEDEQVAEDEAAAQEKEGQAVVTVPD